jgi:hypothetical protein
MYPDIVNKKLRLPANVFQFYDETLAQRFFCPAPLFALVLHAVSCLTLSTLSLFLSLSLFPLPLPLPSPLPLPRLIPSSQQISIRPRKCRDSEIFMATSKSLSRNSYKIAEKEDQNNPALAINARLLREDAGSNPAISKFKVSDPLGVSLACLPLVAPCSRAYFHLSANRAPRDAAFRGKCVDHHPSRVCTAPTRALELPCYRASGSSCGGLVCDVGKGATGARHREHGNSRQGTPSVGLQNQLQSAA